MHALTEVVSRFERRDFDDLSEIEMRALVWARCALAALYGIRIDDLMSDVTVTDLDAWTEQAVSGYDRRMTDSRDIRR